VVAYQAGTNATGMECDYSNFTYKKELKTAATRTAKSMGRCEAINMNKINGKQGVRKITPLLMHLSFTGNLNKVGNRNEN